MNPIIYVCGICNPSGEMKVLKAFFVREEAEMFREEYVPEPNELRGTITIKEVELE